MPKPEQELGRTADCGNVASSHAPFTYVPPRRPSRRSVPYPTRTCRPPAGSDPSAARRFCYANRFDDIGGGPVCHLLALGSIELCARSVRRVGLRRWLHAVRWRSDRQLWKRRLRQRLWSGPRGRSRRSRGWKAAGWTPGRSCARALCRRQLRAPWWPTGRFRSSHGRATRPPAVPQLLHPRRR